MTNETRTALLALLVSNAAAAVSGFPQYAGRFDNMKIGIATKGTKTKAGVAVIENEMVLFERTADARFVTIWSVSNKCLTSVRAKTINEV